MEEGQEEAPLVRETRPKKTGSGRGERAKEERGRGTPPPKLTYFSFLSLTISHRIPHLGNKVWDG